MLSASLLALSFNATIPESPCKNKAFLWCQNGNSKFCLLIDLWTRTLDCWSRNSSTWELDDKNTMEFLTFVLQKPICWKILSRRKWVMCLTYYLASATPFSGCRKVLFLLPLELPKSEDCGEKMYPKGQFPFFPCITRLKSFTSQPYTSTV